MMSRIAAALAVLLVGFGILPHGEVHRCLRSGAIMPPTHACCPDEASEKKAAPPTLSAACCETVPGVAAVAPWTESRNDGLLRSPELAAAPIVLRVPAPLVNVGALPSPSDSGRPPPGDRLRVLSTVLRV